jgi:hypothetical protein
MVSAASSGSMLQTTEKRGDRDETAAKTLL